MLVPVHELCYQAEPLSTIDVMTRKSDDHRPRPSRDKKRDRRHYRANTSKASAPRPHRAPPEPIAAERIAKVIARAGLCSRRNAEAWIAAGRVAVNGRVLSSPALDVTANDRITVDGNLLPQRERTRLFLYNKPRGLVTTNIDPEGRPTIFDALPKHLPRLLTIGRLDVGTEGLLLLTNDGGLARVLELPETGWLRRYRVRALGRITQPDLDRLRAGVTVDGIRYGPIEATFDREQGANVWLTFAIREGKNREVRNVLGHLGLQVNRLIRVSYGPFQLGELEQGMVEEVKTRVLREQLGEHVVELAGCDFAGPIIERAAEPAPSGPPVRAQRRHERTEPRLRVEREQYPRGDRDKRGPGRPQRFDDDRRKGGLRHEKRRDFERSAEKPPGRPRRGHAWRQDDAPLRRHYRGERKDAALRAAPVADKRAGLVTDRKGRRVLVERFGAEKTAPIEPQRKFGAKRGGKPPRHGKAGRRDRSSGPRPSRPRER